MSPAAIAFWLSAIFVAAAVVSTCAALLARSDERLADVEPEPVPLPSIVRVLSLDELARRRAELAP